MCQLCHYTMLSVSCEQKHCLFSFFLKVNVSCYPSIMERGEIIDTGVGWSHLLGKIRRDECDFIVGAFFPDHEVYIDFGPTMPIFQNDYTW